MTDPAVGPEEPTGGPVHPEPGDPAAHPAASADPPASGDPPAGWRRWTRASTFGPVLLVVLMVAAGVFAAITVTPPSDEEALARPDDADVVLASGAPLSWDPAVISDSTSAQLLSQVFEGLTVLDAESRLRPALAESLAMSDDGRRLTAILRPGLTFSDGSPIDANDVRRSWLRVLDPARPSPLASLLDDVVGAAAYARGQGSAEAVGVHADGRTLTVDFDRPAAYFPAVTAVPTLAVVPEAIDALARGPESGAPFVASGPYVPASQVLGELRLEANAAYWAGAPAIEDVAVVTDDGGRSSVDIFEDDAVDWTLIGDSDASWIRYDHDLGPQLRRTEAMAVDFLGFDTTRPPFDDARVRRAVAMAVDWRGLEQASGSDAVPTTSIVPPGVAGRDDADHRLPYDPDAARAELAAAGYPGGAGFPVVSLATYGIGPTTAVAEELARKLGIEVRVEHRPFQQHSRLLDTDTPAMWTLSWSADYPHAHDFLGLLLRSDSGANAGGWHEPAFDALVDQAAATADATAQTALYAQAQDLVRDEAPLIPLGYGGTWSLSRAGLRGANVSGAGILRFADLAWDR